MKPSLFLFLFLSLSFLVTTSYADRPRCVPKYNCPEDDLCKITGTYKGIFAYAGKTENELIRVNVTGKIEKNPSYLEGYYLRLTGEDGSIHNSSIHCTYIIRPTLETEFNGDQYSGNARSGLILLYGPTRPSAAEHIYLERTSSKE